jgi:hypothetical protein
VRLPFWLGLEEQHGAVVEEIVAAARGARP